MAWTEPKVDWVATDPAPHTELNAIGANLAYLFDRHDRFVISSAVLPTVALPVNEFTAMQTIFVTVPAGKILSLKHIRYKLGPTTIALRVETAEVAVPHAVLVAYTSASYEGDDALDEVLYDNTLGADYDLLVMVGIYRTGAAGSPPMNTYGGFVVDMENE